MAKTDQAPPLLLWPSRASCSPLYSYWYAANTRRLPPLHRQHSPSRACFVQRSLPAIRHHPCAGPVVQHAPSLHPRDCSSRFDFHEFFAEVLPTCYRSRSTSSSRSSSPPPRPSSASPAAQACQRPSARPCPMAAPPSPRMPWPAVARRSPRHIHRHGLCGVSRRRRGGRTHRTQRRGRRYPLRTAHSSSVRYIEQHPSTGRSTRASARRRAHDGGYPPPRPGPRLEETLPPLLMILFTVCTMDLMAGLSIGCFTYTLFALALKPVQRSSPPRCCMLDADLPPLSRTAGTTSDEPRRYVAEQDLNPQLPPPTIAIRQHLTLVALGKRPADLAIRVGRLLAVHSRPLAYGSGDRHQRTPHRLGRPRRDVSW